MIYLYHPETGKRVNAFSVQCAKPIKAAEFRELLVVDKHNSDVGTYKACIDTLIKKYTEEWGTDKEHRTAINKAIQDGIVL